MKLLIASDIHGSAYWCDRLCERIAAEAPDRVILLGDLLYHGPRNDLPRDYDPKRVAAALNAISPAPICVRGNCEAEVDQMMLHFPVLADYSSLLVGDRVIFLTHGHLFPERAFPCTGENDIVLSGHTHVPVWKRTPGTQYLNPGSVSIPKGESTNSYMTYTEDTKTFAWRRVEDGGVYAYLAL